MFRYIDEKLVWREKPLEPVLRAAADRLARDFQFTGPFWLYQEKILSERLSLLESRLPGCGFYYSVKSQSNLGILARIAERKSFGADVVSGGELYRALKAGFPPEKIVFAGVGKSEAEIASALDLRIRSLHVESISELKDIERIARDKDLMAAVTLRLNPDVEVDTHRHITTGKEENKFGLSENDFQESLRILKGAKQLKLVGLQAHIGSQIFDAAPYIETATFLAEKYNIVKNALQYPLQYISLGGGFGVKYENLEGDAVDFDFAGLTAAVRKIFGESIEIHFEPGRFISAPLGILLTRVRHLKERTGKTIAIIDAAMNDLIRPMLYEAYHPILPVLRRPGQHTYDVVGPVCESTDTFATKRRLTEIHEKDWLAIGYAGAYGSCMSSNFNTRPLLPELLLSEKGDLEILRKPQTLEQMLAGEV
ncbi:MAG: diaminopimelate decarboxylase [Turneriella sp.]|nr:diaminopimelate decarboxylase [Turneriella sp.]